MKMKKKKSIQFYFTIYKLENVQKNKFLEFLLMRYFERFFNIDAEEKRRGIYREKEMDSKGNIDERQKFGEQKLNAGTKAS